MIAILAALQSELEPLRRYVRLEAPVRTPAATFAPGRWHEREIVTVRTGVGKVHAAMATQSVLDRYSPARIVVIGSAGALTDELPLGTILVPREVAPHDVGTFFPGGFRPGSRLVGTPPGPRVFVRTFPCAAGLVEAALTCGRNHGLPVRDGKLLSGDQAIFSTARRDWLRRTFNALAVDMESAAVAQIAAAHGVPLLVLRAISDHAGDQTGFDTTPLHQATDALLPSIMGRTIGLAQRARYLLTHPRSAWRRHRFQRGITAASENVALLLDDLLRE